MTSHYKPRDIRPKDQKQYDSMKETYKFLLMMMDPKQSPGIPRIYRDCARKCIRDFPIDQDLKIVISKIRFFNPVTHY